MKRYSFAIHFRTVDGGIYLEEGHMGRHMRRMRELYADVLQTLRSETEKTSQALLEIPDIKAGLYTAGFLRNGMSSRESVSRDIPIRSNRCGVPDLQAFGSVYHIGSAKNVI